MKYGFRYITEPARDKLSELGIDYKNESGSMTISTDMYDDIVDERVERDITVDDSSDMQRRYRAQATRMIKWEDGRYFYLIRDVVFVQEPRTFTDHRFTPPTIEVVSILDVIPREDQELWRDRLIKYDIAVNRPLI